MRKAFLAIAITIATIAVPAAFAQKYLPNSFGAWSANASAADSASAPTSPFEPGVLDEYGIKSQETRTYTGGADRISLTLYQMIDPTGAYGAFTYLHTPEMHKLGVTKYSVGSDDRAIVVIGNFLIDSNGPHIASRTADLKILADSLKPTADQRPFPYVAEHLPEQGLIAGSERYIIGTWGLATFAPISNGDWVGFDQGAEAILARYRSGAQEASLIVIEYPTQQIAAAHEEGVAKLANGTPSRGHPAIKVERKANLISLAITDNSGEFGESLMGQVHFGHDVMWNEPSFKAKEPRFNVMVVGAFLGTGVILALAIISGLGFGLLRILLKVFFPGKVFDRHRSIEIIQLGLSGRPIDTKELF